ncbi:MAG: hypothetical protein ACTSO4_17790 [Promethearchaeota archaeon]
MKSKKLMVVFIVSVIIVSVSLGFLFLTLITFHASPQEKYIQEYPITGNTDLNDISNKNDLILQNRTFTDVSSNLTYTNKVESKFFYGGLIDSYWNGHNWSLTYTCKISYEYNDSFINSLKYDLTIGRSGDLTPCNVYFWNYSAGCYQFNISTVGGYVCFLDSDFYQNGEFKFKLNASSTSYFSIVPYGYCHFNYSIYISDEIILYTDLGNGYRNQYENITWNSSYDILKLSIYWCSSPNNYSWSNYEPSSNFSGFGERYIKLNLSLSVFSDTCSFDLMINFQNCSFYYFSMNKTIGAYQNNSFNHIKDKSLKTFNLSLNIGNSSSIFNTSIFLYNFYSLKWVYLGDFSLIEINFLNFTQYINEIDGIRICFIAESYEEFTISYTILIFIIIN